MGVGIKLVPKQKAFPGLFCYTPVAMPEVPDQVHPKYRRDIDGLRGLAVLAVVAFHAFPSLAKTGFIGVDVFFVISGFLITTIILGGLERGTFSFIAFYARRVRRIFPALVVVLAAAFIVAWFAFDVGEMKRLGLHLLGGATFSSNFLLWHEGGYFDIAENRKPLLHLWSLAIEEQFYLLFPLGLWAAWKFRFRMLATVCGFGAASFVLNILIARFNPHADFYLPLTRVWELMLGAMLACIEARPPAWVLTLRTLDRGAGAVLGVGLLVAGFVFVDAGAYPGWWALLPTLGTAFLLFSRASWINQHLLSSRPLVAAGLISYPLYLWHWPILSFARILNGGSPPASIRGLLIVVAFILAWLTMRYVERPLRFGANGAKAVKLLLGGLAAIGGVGLAAIVTDGYPFRHTARNVERYVRSIAVATGKTVCQEDGTQGVSCRIGESDAEATVLVIGDSHAGSLLPAFERLSHEENIGVRYGAISVACPPFSRAEDPCVEENRRVLYDARSRDIKDVFFVFRWSNYERGRMLEAFLDPSVRAYRQAGARVHLVVDNPLQSMDPRDALRRGRNTDNGINRFAIPSETYAAQQDPLAERLARYAVEGGEVTVVDLRTAWCANGLCPLSEDGKFLYGDINHVSADGAMLAYPILRDAL